MKKQPVPVLRSITKTDIERSPAAMLAMQTLYQGKQHAATFFLPHEGFMNLMRSAWVRGEMNGFLHLLEDYFKQAATRLPQVIKVEQIEPTIADLRSLIEQELIIGQVAQYLLGVANRP